MARARSDDVIRAFRRSKGDIEATCRAVGRPKRSVRRILQNAGIIEKRAYRYAAEVAVAEVIEERFTLELVVEASVIRGLAAMAKASDSTTREMAQSILREATAED